MAYYGGHGRYGGRGRASTAFSNYQKDDDDKPDTGPLVDKNPHYRTNDIFNGKFKKKIRLLDAPNGPNSTDGQIINLKFRDPIKRRVVGKIRESDGEKVYRLECGHPRVLKKAIQIDSLTDCWVCGNHQSYLALQHEWSHNIFHSFKCAWQLFVEQNAEEYAKLAPGVDVEFLKGFLHLVVNAYDDIRCNSLFGLVYRGAAADIWERWQRLGNAHVGQTKDNFIAYILNLAVDADIDPDTEFESLRPIVEWSMNRVRGRGPANMLAIVKVALDRCIGALIKKIPPKQAPPPPQQGASSPSAGQPGQAGGSSGQQPDPGQQSGQQGGQPQGLEGQNTDGEGGDTESDIEQDIPPPTDMPSAKDLKAAGQDLTQALGKLAGGAKPFDSTTDHPKLDAEGMAKDPNAQIAQQMVQYAMGMDQQDLQAFDQVLTGAPDADVAKALQTLQDGMTDKSPDSQLTDGAKAKILFIDVAPSHIEEVSYVTIAAEEQRYVDSLRSAFYKVMGQQKASRGMEGQELDVQMAIQYLIETGFDEEDEALGTGGNQNIFKNLTTQQGFAYLILCDMSGSMHRTFPHVAQAATMLKKALDFPFVTGDLWGFRGAEAVKSRTAPDGEVWLYRYHHRCRGYTGMSPVKFGKGYSMFPVECGGITPMNSALKVSSKHMLVRVPAGMAKRLFILTDGSPLQTKVTGQSLPEFLLRGYVQKEVMAARQHGVQVYALIIGNSIPDDHAKKMFGHPRFWKRVSSYDPGEVGRTLFSLVKDNFTKYLKIHGGG